MCVCQSVCVWTLYHCTTPSFVTQHTHATRSRSLFVDRVTCICPARLTAQSAPGKQQTTSQQRRHQRRPPSPCRYANVTHTTHSGKRGGGEADAAFCDARLCVHAYMACQQGQGERSAFTLTLHLLFCVPRAHSHGCVHKSSPPPPPPFFSFFCPFPSSPKQQRLHPLLQGL